MPRTAATRQHAIGGQQAPGYGLFPGGVGNTQKDPARFGSLYAGVVAKIFDRLPDETWVYPGHGGDTTLGAERPHLEEWRERGW
jgi:glyoxylase-like metal-dependent hydrolase (beta-lactamase superfamily II)